jgi:hypothetical protein
MNMLARVDDEEQDDELSKEQMSTLRSTWPKENSSWQSEYSNVLLATASVAYNSNIIYLRPFSAPYVPRSFSRQLGDGYMLRINIIQPLMNIAVFPAISRMRSRVLLLRILGGYMVVK